MFAALPRQPTLFDRGEPDVSAARLTQLARTSLDDTAWVEHLPAWVTGEDALMEILLRTTRWREEHQEMYGRQDRKSTRLNSSHTVISYAVFCLKKKKKE